MNSIMGNSHTSTKVIPAASRRSILIAALLTAALLIVASFFPTSRVWGASEWAYLAIWVRIILIVVLGIAAGMILWSRQLVFEEEHEPGADSHIMPPWFAVLLLASTAGLVFYTFRTQVHFLGDGFLLLKSLASESPLLRGRNYGEMLIHIWLKDALPLESEAAALTSFRIISIGAGVIHTAVVALLAPIILGNGRQGWLFALGMMTGGYALLHFGYVENYSLFGLAVAIYVYLGILISMKRISVWWIVPALMAAVFFHALGITLLPATLYALLVYTPLASRLSKLGRIGKAAMIVVVSLVLVSVAYGLLDQYMYLRFAFVPIGNDPWMLEGYSMFSLSHIADVANLLFLLVPSLLVMAVAIVRMDLRRVARDPRIQFLGITTLSVVGAAFVLEAKIGMPRDWDLFSFIGYPLMALGLLTVLSASNRPYANRIILIAVTIAALCLAPRVMTASIPAQGIKQFRNYAEIDSRKNRTGWYVLNQYYSEHSDTVASDSVSDLRRQRFPEEVITRLAMDVYARKQIDSAIQLSRAVIDLNPTYASAWVNLGNCYTYQRQYDSAVRVLEISNALNPNAPRVLADLGLVYLYLDRYDDAEQAFLEAYWHDTSIFEPTMALARLYQKRGDHESYVAWLERAVYREEADGIWATELGDEYLRKGDFRNAASAFQHALDKGSDSATIMLRINTHPELVRFLR